MADAGKNATTTHDGDGATTQFAIGFSFLDPDHVEVSVGGSPNTEFTVDSDLTTITFDAAPASGSNNIVITRNTPSSALINAFTNGAGVTEDDLNNAFLQCLYYAEEVEDLT